MTVKRKRQNKRNKIAPPSLVGLVVLGATHDVVRVVVFTHKFVCMPIRKTSHHMNGQLERVGIKWEHTHKVLCFGAAAVLLVGAYLLEGKMHHESGLTSYSIETLRATALSPFVEGLATVIGIKSKV